MSKLKTEVSLIERNGRTVSKRTAFFENGQIAETGIYSISQHGWSWNVPVGVVKSYFENGQLKSEISYNENGSLDGECLYYDSHGTLLKKQSYAKDKLINEEVFVVEEDYTKEKF